MLKNLKDLPIRPEFRFLQNAGAVSIFLVSKVLMTIQILFSSKEHWRAVEVTIIHC